jgi:hypothetical protein
MTITRETAILTATDQLDAMCDDYSCGKPSMADVAGHARDIASKTEFETSHKLAIKSDENGITFI